MLALASITALVLATSSFAITSPSEILTPSGVGCEGTADLTLETDPSGHPYMSGSGKMICGQPGPGSVTVVLYKNGAEAARKTIETLETSAIAAVAAPCVNGRDEVSWVMIAQYLDDYIGMTVQHRFAKNTCG
jgi:ABC-type phosphate/phosphonate transport system substrate-binding protein